MIATTLFKKTVSELFSKRQAFAKKEKILKTMAMILIKILNVMCKIYKARTM